jgi:hypothetical protein
LLGWLRGRRQYVAPQKASRTCSINVTAPATN